MKLHLLLPLVVVVGCDSGPSKEESVQVFATANAALETGRIGAVAEAGGGNDLVLDYSGPCSLGGSISLNGSYTDTDVDSSDTAAFDLAAVFTSCKEPTGTLDGDLRWASTAGPAGYTMSMDGFLEWTGSQGSGSCELDIEIAITEALVSYKGSLCGHDLTSDISLTGR